MNRKFSLRQVAAAAAVSAAAGHFGGSCEPISERLMAARDMASAEQRCEEYIADAQTPRLIGLIAHRAVRQSASVLRSELEAGENGPALIEYRFRISGRGSLQLAGADAICDGRACPGMSELPEMIGVLIASEWSVEPSGKDCSMLIKVEVPSMEGSQRRVRHPAPGQSIDL